MQKEAITYETLPQTSPVDAFPEADFSAPQELSLPPSGELDQVETFSRFNSMRQFGRRSLAAVGITLAAAGGVKALEATALAQETDTASLSYVEREQMDNCKETALFSGARLRSIGSVNRVMQNAKVRMQVPGISECSSYGSLISEITLKTKKSGGNYVSGTTKELASNSNNPSKGLLLDLGRTCKKGTSLSARVLVRPVWTDKTGKIARGRSTPTVKKIIC